MDRRIQATAVALLLAAPAAAAPVARDPQVLASYSFEDDTPTGPDTFRIFEYGRGTVRLTRAFHVSGYRAIEIKDVAGDKTMPEIQGYFALRDRGRLYAHFSFLTATPKEQFDIALAGPACFKLAKDGIAFWLEGKDGRLVHYSDSIPKRLFDLEAFVWYTADVAYDVTAGVYDLTIHREGEAKPLVSLVRQLNAAHQPGSSVDKFSFVGEPWGDSSNVTYYVDDVMIATDDRVRQRPFVAPGRRKLFLDWFAEYEKKQREKPGCLPVLGALDLGLTGADTQALVKQGLIGGLEDLIAGTNGDLAPGLRATPRLEAVALWSAGCRALDAGRGQDALRDFERAAERAPGARLYPLSAVLALVRLGRFAEADERIGLVYSEWRDDPRYAVVSALVGSARGDLDKAEAWLRDPAERALLGGGNALLRDLRGGRLSPDVLARLKKEMPDEWQQRLSEALVSEQYYYVLLWRGRYDAARDYALRMADRYRALSLPVWDWQERAADGAFYGKGFDEARGLYEGILEVESRWSVILKLSDLAFFTGDLERERALRQQYWGVLDER